MACSNFTFGNCLATLSVGFMKPNEVVKISPWPSVASLRITRSASGPSATLSTAVVVTLPGNAASSSLRATSWR